MATPTQSGINPIFLGVAAGLGAALLYSELRPREVKVSTTDGDGVGVDEAERSEAVSADIAAPEAAAAAAAGAVANVAGTAKAAAPAPKGFDAEMAAVSAVQGRGGAERLFNSRVPPEQYPSMGDVGQPLKGQGIGMNTDFLPAEQDLAAAPPANAVVDGAGPRTGGIPTEPAPARSIYSDGAFADAAMLTELRNASYDLRGDVAIPVTELPEGASMSTIGPHSQRPLNRRSVIDDAVPPPLSGDYAAFFK